MHINPIYRKELTLQTRSLKLPLVFMFFIFILTFVAGIACAVFFDGSGSSDNPSSAMINIYICLAAAEFGIILLEIPAFTADAIAGERERQTLDILLTTSLPPIQIVAGKLMSSLSTLFLLAFLTLPVLGMTFSVGGVSCLDLVQLFLLIFTAMFFIGSLSIFFSAAWKRTSLAAALSYLALFLITAGTLAAVLIAVRISGVRADAVYNQTGNLIRNQFHVLPLLLLINPAFTMFYMMEKNYDSRYAWKDLFEFFHFEGHEFLMEHWFLVSILVQVLLGGVFLVLAAKEIDPGSGKRKTKDGYF